MALREGTLYSQAPQQANLAFSNNVPHLNGNHTSTPHSSQNIATSTAPPSTRKSFRQPSYLAEPISSQPQKDSSIPNSPLGQRHDRNSSSVSTSYPFGLRVQKQYQHDPTAIPMVTTALNSSANGAEKTKASSTTSSSQTSTKPIDRSLNIDPTSHHKLNNNHAEPALQKPSTESSRFEVKVLPKIITTDTKLPNKSILGKRGRDLMNDTSPAVSDALSSDSRSVSSSNCAHMCHSCNGPEKAYNPLTRCPYCPRRWHYGCANPPILHVEAIGGTWKGCTCQTGNRSSSTGDRSKRMHQHHMPPRKKSKSSKEDRFASDGAVSTSNGFVFSRGGKTFYSGPISVSSADSDVEVPLGTTANPISLSESPPPQKPVTYRVLLDTTSKMLPEITTQNDRGDSLSPSEFIYKGLRPEVGTDSSKRLASSVALIDDQAGESNRTEGTARIEKASKDRNSVDNTKSAVARAEVEHSVGNVETIATKSNRGHENTVSALTPQYSRSEQPSENDDVQQDSGELQDEIAQIQRRNFSEEHPEIDSMLLKPGDAQADSIPVLRQNLSKEPQDHSIRQEPSEVHSMSEPQQQHKDLPQDNDISLVDFHEEVEDGGQSVAETNRSSDSNLSSVQSVEDMSADEYPDDPDSTSSYSAPDTLHVSQDTERPKHTWSSLIVEAFAAHDNMPMVNNAIASWIVENYPWYRNWNFSKLTSNITAILSQYVQFEKKGRVDETNVNSKCYWGLVSDVTFGKQQRGKSASAVQPMDPENVSSQIEDQPDLLSNLPAAPNYTVKQGTQKIERKRGRNGHAKEWCDLKQLYEIETAGMNIRPDDVVVILLENWEDSFACIRDIRASDSGLVMCAVHWFYTFEHFRRQTPNVQIQRQWPNECNIMVSNWLEVVSIAAIERHATSTELSSFYLGPKFLDVSSKTPKIRNHPMNDSLRSSEHRTSEVRGDDSTVMAFNDKRTSDKVDSTQRTAPMEPSKRKRKMLAQVFFGELDDEDMQNLLSEKTDRIADLHNDLELQESQNQPCGQTKRSIRANRNERDLIVNEMKLNRYGVEVENLWDSQVYNDLANRVSMLDRLELRYLRNERQQLLIDGLLWDNEDLESFRDMHDVYGWEPEPLTTVSPPHENSIHLKSSKKKTFGRLHPSVGRGEQDSAKVLKTYPSFFSTPDANFPIILHGKLIPSATNTVLHDGVISSKIGTPGGRSKRNRITRASRNGGGDIVINNS